MSVNWETIQQLGPEFILIIAATWIYVVGAFARLHQWWPYFAALSFGAAGLVLFYTDYPRFADPDLTQAYAPTGPLAVDVLGYHLRGLAILVGLLFSLFAASPWRTQQVSELIGSVVLISVGVMLVSRANDLILLFVALELVSIPTYVVLYLGRNDRRCAESAMKYFFLSIFASALFLYGVSFLYGVGQSTVISGPGEGTLQASLRALGAAESAAGSVWLARLGLVLVFAGLGFKIAAAPFHFYAPDVYEGATNANAGLLAVAPKIAGIAALMRLTVALAPGVAEFGWQLTLVLAVVTMTFGNVCALWQKDLRRLMAYSSIAHAGYMLIGITIGMAAPADASLYGGLAAVLFYLLTYVLASIAFFALLSYLGNETREVGHIDALSGLYRSHPLIATAIAVCMFSLAGIPPLAGFWGKLTLFASVLGAASAPSQEAFSGWFLALAILGAINAAIAAAYYLRIIGVMYFGVQEQAPRPRGGRLTAFAGIAAISLLVLVSITPGRALTSAHQADRALRLSAAPPAATPAVSSTTPRKAVGPSRTARPTVAATQP